MENVTDRGATFAGRDERTTPLPAFSKVQMQSHIYSSTEKKMQP